MAAEVKEAVLSIQPSDQDQARATQAWHVLLDGIQALASARGLKKKIFISYAWPPAGEGRDTLHAFLKRLQNDFKRAGIEVFLDVRGMQGNMDLTMQTHLQDSDFVMPILTPGFLARIKEAEHNNLQFEFNLMMEKVKANPACLLPILAVGGFREVVQGPLALLSKYMVYTLQTQASIPPSLVGLSDPLGIIPVIYGIAFDDADYQALYFDWLANGLTRLPQPLLNAVERGELTGQLFRRRLGGHVSVQVIQGAEGMGKTQLALDYAHEHSERKTFVCWLQADNQHLLRAEWLRLGVALGLDLKGLPTDEQKLAIRQALAQKDSWLIVLDSLEDKAALEGLLPQALSSTQQVLITTRSQNWGAYPVLEVVSFTPEESEAFFLQQVPQHQLRRGHRKLAEALKHSPAALVRAVHYMQEHHKTAAELLQIMLAQQALQGAPLVEAAAAPVAAAVVAVPAPPIAAAPEAIPVSAATKEALVANNGPGLFAPAAAQVDSQQIAVLEAKLKQLEENRAALLENTAQKAADGKLKRPAVQDAKELAERIETLKKERDACDDEDEDFPKEKAVCLKQCVKAAKELPKLEQEIAAAKRNLQRLKGGSQASHINIKHGGIYADGANIEAEDFKAGHEDNIDEAGPGLNVSVEQGDISFKGAKINAKGTVHFGNTTNIGGGRRP